MPGRRARTGRGWDAAPPRARRHTSGGGAGDASGAESDAFGSGPDAFSNGADAFGSGADAFGSPDAAGGGSDAFGSRSGTFGSRPGASGSGAGTFAGGAASGRNQAEGRAAGATGRPPKPPVDPYEAAREICLHQLSFRPRTRAELAATLHKRGVDDDVAVAVLDRYDEVGLIDDAAFAKAWVTTRHHGRGLARRALANELRQRGVDVEIVDEALDALDGDTEAATARTLVDRKLRGMGSAPPDAVFRRLVAMLARKGYPAGVSIATVKEALADREASAAFANELDVDALADEGAERWVSD